MMTTTTTEYAMNTRTRVKTMRPYDNEFGHTNATFVYLEDAYAPGTKRKVYVTYGGTYTPGEVRHMINDTGMGHRHMPSHRVLAVRYGQDGPIHGLLPAVASLPLWVAK